MMVHARNKLWRREHAYRLFKARMIRLAACQTHTLDQDGNPLLHPHWFELARLPWSRTYRTTGTPCSCTLCKGARYNRRQNKKECLSILQEESMI